MSQLISLLLPSIMTFLLTLVVLVRGAGWPESLILSMVAALIVGYITAPDKDKP